jgi:hypothetical protein
MFLKTVASIQLPVASEGQRRLQLQEQPQDPSLRSG